MKIDHLERFQIKEKETGHLFCGCNQEWYFGARQRRSGCGPTVFSNILLYLFHEVYAKNACVYKEDALALMDEIGNILPTLLGCILRRFYQRPWSMDRKREWTMNMRCWVSAENILANLRWKKRFGLSKSDWQEVPVAFLNLCSGRAKILTDGIG